MATVYITPHELFQNMKHARRAAKELAAYDYIDPGEKVFIVKVPDND